MKEYLTPDEKGDTPLENAARAAGLWGVVQDLAASGEAFPVEVLTKNNRNTACSIVYWAASNGDLPYLMELYQAAGERLSLRDLLMKDESPFGRTPLGGAAYNGHLDQVMEVLRASGETLTAQHLLLKDEEGFHAVYWAARGHHLDQIFIPSLWKGRVKDMMELWQEVSKGRQEAIDFPFILKEAIQLSVDAAPRMNGEALAGVTRAFSSSIQPEPSRDVIK